MIGTFERIISYVLGAVIGAGAGTFLLSTNLEALHDPVCEGLIRSLTPLIGLLVSMIVVEYRHELLMRRERLLRDETVALITHEMRTSLTSTGWAIGMVLKKYDQALQDSDRHILTGVVDSIHTTVMHSVNLLDVSLLDIGKLAISLQWTSLEKVHEMFEEIYKKYDLGMHAKSIEFEKNLVLDTARMAEVDMTRLRIIVENLLENAMQYTVGPIKKISIDITNDENHMNIKVSDSGIGIPESEKEKIFSEFYRASNARKTLSTGSGIGLYTCAKYVKAHGGTIRFESKEGEGTTFCISVPLKTEADVKGFLQKI